MEIKKNIPNNTITRKLVDLDRETGNIYETVNIIARRANQISAELKTELNRTLADRNLALLRTPAQTGDHRHRGVPRRRAFLQGGREDGELTRKGVSHPLPC